MSNPISASLHKADSQRDKPSLGAIFEIAGLWWLTLCAGVLLIAALLLQVYGREVENIQRSSVSLTVAELQESIETDIALGLELAENRSIQSHLEAALVSDANLHAIDVVNKNGVALFSTDRGAIGETWQQDVARAAEDGARRNRQWSARISAEAVTGLVLHNAFGEVIGHVSATYAAPPSRFSLSAIRAGLPIWLATSAALLVLTIAAWIAARWALQPQYRYLHAERDAAMNRAVQDARTVRGRIDDCLAKLDESEAAQ